MIPPLPPFNKSKARMPEEEHTERGWGLKGGFFSKSKKCQMQMRGIFQFATMLRERLISSDCNMQIFTALNLKLFYLAGFLLH